MYQIFKLISGAVLMIWFITAQANGQVLFGGSSKKAVRSGYGRVLHK